MKKMIMHYYLHDRDQDRHTAHAFAYNGSYLGQDERGYQRRHNNFMINPAEFQYSLNLIPNELTLMIYNEGDGNYPVPGEYITVSQRVYMQGQHNNHIKSKQKHYIYGRNRNPKCLELAFSMMKPSTKAMVVIGSELSVDLLRLDEKNKNKKVIYEFYITSISVFPPSSDNLLEILFTEIMNFTNSGDKAFEEHQMEESFFNYQCAIQRIFSPTFASAVHERRKDIESTIAGKKGKKVPYPLTTLTAHNSVLHPNINDPKMEFEIKDYYLREENKHLLEELKKQLHKINELESTSQKISLKAIQLAFVAQQYFKAIKWAHTLLKNPRYDRNIRTLMIRAHSYLHLEEFELALDDFKLIKLFYPSLNEIDQQLKQLQQKIQNSPEVLELNFKSKLVAQKTLNKMINQSMDYYKSTKEQSEETRKIKDIQIEKAKLKQQLKIKMKAQEQKKEAIKMQKKNKHSRKIGRV